MGASSSIYQKKIYYLPSPKDANLSILADLNNYVNTLSVPLVDNLSECEIIILPVSKNLLTDFQQCSAINYSEENDIPILFICLSNDFNPDTQMGLKKIMKNYSFYMSSTDFNSTIEKINNTILSF